MARKHLFPGLVVDENGKPVDAGYVGEEPCYIVNDAGFHRHIPSEQVDRQVFGQMAELIKGNEDFISQQTAKMLKQDDIFSKAIIQNQLKNIDTQVNTLLEIGIPQESLAYLGMMGFKIVINYHGDVINVEQPGALGGEDEGE